MWSLDWRPAVGRATPGLGVLGWNDGKGIAHWYCHMVRGQLSGCGTAAHERIKVCPSYPFSFMWLFCSLPQPLKTRSCGSKLNGRVGNEVTVWILCSPFFPYKAVQMLEEQHGREVRARAHHPVCLVFACQVLGTTTQLRSLVRGSWCWE